MSIYLITHVKDDGSEEIVGYCKSYYEASRVEGYLIGTEVYGPNAVFSIEEVIPASIDFWKSCNRLKKLCEFEKLTEANKKIDELLKSLCNRSKKLCEVDKLMEANKKIDELLKSLCVL